jgi:hypothetical protein
MVCIIRNQVFGHCYFLHHHCEDKFFNKIPSKEAMSLHASKVSSHFLQFQDQLAKDCKIESISSFPVMRHEVSLLYPMHA